MDLDVNVFIISDISQVYLPLNTNVTLKGKNYSFYGQLLERHVKNLVLTLISEMFSHKS